MEDEEGDAAVRQLFCRTKSHRTISVLQLRGDSRDRMIGSRTSDSLSATFPSNRKTDIYKPLSYIYIELKGPDEMKTV